MDYCHYLFDWDTDIVDNGFTKKTLVCVNYVAEP